jgi:hypothetical protein
MDLEEQKHMLTQFRQLIEISQRRGVWMANEMEHIGSTYNNVESILSGIETFEEGERQKQKKSEKPKEKVKDNKSPKLKIVKKKEETNTV